MSNLKIHLGDGVHADLHGKDIILTNQDGLSNQIVLKPEAAHNFAMWLIETQKLIAGGKG